MRRAAQISRCGRYRWTLARQWAIGPQLLVVMFNPSTADAEKDDPTILTLCQRAVRWGYGSIVVVNLVPLRSSAPGEAVDMVETWDERRAWDERDALQRNLTVIQEQVRTASAILLAYGALGGRLTGWTDHVVEEIASVAYGRATPLYCLGRTGSGFPIHPLARGKWRVPDDAPLQLWTRAH